MRLILLTRFHAQHKGSAFVLRLQAEAEICGHTLQHINPAEVILSFQGGPQKAPFPVSWQGQPFPQADLIIPMLRNDDETGWQIAEALRGWGRMVQPVGRLPLGQPVTLARLFAQRGIAAPRTWVLSQANQLAMIQPELIFPCILRARSGGQGRRLMVAQHTGEAEVFLKQLLDSGQSVVVQDLPAPVGEDLRVMLINHRPVVAAHRLAPMGFVRPREDHNRQVTLTQLTPAEEALAVAASRLHGAPFCTVSLLRRGPEENEGTGPLLLEVGRAPVLTELEQVSGLNLMAQVLAHLVQVAKQPATPLVPLPGPLPSAALA